MRILATILLLGVFTADSCAAQRPAARTNESRRQSRESRPAPASTSAIRGVGLALTPAHFPKHSSADVKQMFQMGRDYGKYAIFIYQWSDGNFKRVAKDMVAMSREVGLIPVVALSPTTLSGARGSYDVPLGLRLRSGFKVSFGNEKVQRAFISDAVELAKLKPPYLCLATEINMFAFADIQEYIKFAATYKKAYAEVKKVSPDTKVFVSFQWDYYRIMDDRDPKRIQENSKLIDIFRPELDLVAFTSYPADHFATPAAVPDNYYSRIYDHIKSSDEVMFMELGWPSSGKGSENEQVEFIQRLPALMKDVRPAVIAWPLLHDVSGVFGADLATTGIFDSDGKPKPAAKAFKDLAGK